MVFTVAERLPARCSFLARWMPAGPAHVVWVFDLLYLDRELVMGRPNAERRITLEALPLPRPAKIVTRRPASDTAELLAACAELGGEGLVLKRLGPIELPGRRRPDGARSGRPSGPRFTPSPTHAQTS